MTTPGRTILRKSTGFMRPCGSDFQMPVWPQPALPASLTPSNRIVATLAFGNRSVAATSLAGIADAVEPYRGRLPVITQEIGDTWIYGVPSDPLEVAPGGE